ncbi:MAG: endonuclease domain-containing protein [Synergistaceae bacterium]|nr:endonuclease domain-containing protein [Synergistaceae bacterium]
MIFYKEGLVDRARELRRNMTPQERRLWYSFLKDYPSAKFYRQRSIGSYIADFYCSKFKLVIEIDGAQHSTAEAIEYDRERTEYFQSLGIKVFRFKNYEINTNFKNVCEKIKTLTTN